MIDAIVQLLHDHPAVLLWVFAAVLVLMLSSLAAGWWGARGHYLAETAPADTTPESGADTVPLTVRIPPRTRPGHWPTYRSGKARVWPEAAAYGSRDDVRSPR